MGTSSGFSLFEKVPVSTKGQMALQIRTLYFATVSLKNWRKNLLVHHNCMDESFQD